METVNAGNIAKGMYIMFKDTPHLVLKAEFMAPGKGSPIMRVKFRNVQTGSAGEFTYKTNESVEVAEVEKKEMQYLYRDGDALMFMEPRTFEQAEIPVALLEDKIGLMMADMKCWVLWYKDKAIGIDLPPHVILKVIEAPEGVAGGRVNAPKKPAKLETGMEILVPLFVKEGDRIEIDTSTGEYIARV